MLESGKSFPLEARNGLYQQNKVGADARLLRVGIEEKFRCVPEISANKYQLNVRFLEMDETTRTGVMSGLVPFELIFCSF
jgi:cell division protein ZapD